MAELQRRAQNAYEGWFKQPVLADIERSESVTVVVGSGAASRRFYLHKNLVTSQSAFFTSCLISGWKGSNQNRVDLLHEDPTAFETVLAWLYRYSETFDSLRKSTNPFTAIIPIWCLADKLIMPRLKNDIMDEIQGIAKQRNIVSIPDDVLAVFTSAPVGDTRLGHFYMELFVWTYCTHPGSWSPSIICTNAMIAQPSIVATCFHLIDLFRICGYADPRTKPKCSLHNHDLVAECDGPRVPHDRPPKRKADS